MERTAYPIGYMNMGDPRMYASSTIKWQNKQADGLYFDLIRLAQQQSGITDAAKLLQWTQKYIEEHREELIHIATPNSFMVASRVEDNSADTSNSRNYCEDWHFALAIVGRISGYIYIPSRTISVDKSNFTETFFFQNKELNR